jgi:hypothetical protein
MLGVNPVDVVLGSTYMDAGATAVDAFGLIVPVIATGTINTSVLGSSIITYTATDARGNIASAKRFVNVVSLPIPQSELSPLEVILKHFAQELTTYFSTR